MRYVRFFRYRDADGLSFVNINCKRQVRFAGYVNSYCLRSTLIAPCPQATPMLRKRHFYTALKMPAALMLAVIVDPSGVTSNECCVSGMNVESAPGVMPSGQ